MNAVARTAVVLSAIAVGAVGAAGTAACGSAPGDIAASGRTPAPLNVPVGPIPDANADPSLMVNPFDGDRAAAGEGRRLFTRFNCAGCHGEHGGGGMGPSLRDTDWLYGAQDAQLYASIVQGRAHGMPSWARALAPDQVWRLVAYIRALRTSGEPDPPVTS